MDSAYDRKFEEMKSYIPFLERMIKRLENTNSPTAVNPRQAQLDKIRSLQNLLLNKNKRMKMENLLKCEQVLVNLYTKVEKDTSSKVKPITEQPGPSIDKSELETVRNKLKTVAKIQDGTETLPEIARANDIELNYSGCKEPALFQRRPNKLTKPECAQQSSPSETPNKRTPQKRNYTKVLVSPERSPSRWSASEVSSSDKPLFSRRSPSKIIPLSPLGKKDKKKSKGKSRKTNDLNITLNVPQESLDSLNTEDILSRIINCKETDVDIDKLRELRTQILSELKHTGKNDDISDLILKSYNIKSDPRKNISAKSSKEDVEEGELSDSESEAIESIYGSLPKIYKDKKSLALVKAVENKDQRKIQICLVISDKSQSNSVTKTNEPNQIVDLVSELEMCESKSEKSKSVICIDSDTSSSPPKNVSKNKEVSGNNVKKKIDTTSLPNKLNTKEISECITLEDENEDNANQSIEVLSGEDTDELSLHNHSKNSTESNPTLSANKDTSTSILNDTNTLNKDELESNRNADPMQATNEQQPKFVANFYKPIDEQQNKLPTSSSVVANIQEKEKASEKSTMAEFMNPVDNPTNVTDICAEKQVDGDANKDTLKVNEAKSSETEPTCNEKETQDAAQNIPLLNEPTGPPKAKSSVLSEIDILQALKNEILSESISVPGTEVTPALHQPKLTKVANAQEVMPKKKISFVKYKEQVSSSTTKSLFFRKRNQSIITNEDINKKQSLKLTDKECERFKLPKRLSLDEDDDIDDLTDDDFLAERKDDSLGLDDFYGDLAPQSPDDAISNRSSTPPIIIPTDAKSFEASASKNTKLNDVDMRERRVLLPTPPQQLVPLPVPAPITPSMGFGPLPSPPAFGIDRTLSELNVDTNKKLGDVNRMSNLDPRIRRDINLSAMNSPNPYSATNPERTPRPFVSVVPSAPNMTPSRTPSMTPNMTPSYMPSMPQLRTPNARTFEMTPTHQTFELEEPTARKHVYAPSFSMSDNRERETSISRDGPHWDMTKCDPRSRRSRWEDSNKRTGGPKWDDRDPRSVSGQKDGSHTPRYDDSSNYDKYNNRIKGDNCIQDRRESYSRVDCPMTPIPSFGWSECPPTPGSSFGRQEAPMTPSHPFGRSDCPSTPVHPFGRDCPPTPSSGFGRDVDMASNHSYSRLECPPTPGHSFGRSERPQTPSHPYGRSDCPQTPNHPYGRSECPRTPSHSFGRSESIPYNNRSDISSNSNQANSKDPRINRRTTEYESSSHNERDYDYRSERYNKNYSYKSQNKHYSESDTSKSYDRERNDRHYGDRNFSYYDKNRRDLSGGQSTSRDVENNRLYSRIRESRYEGRDYDSSSRRNQREKSVGRSSDTNQYFERARSTSRSLSVSRNIDKESKKDNISFQSDSGRNFIINTSIKSTFQDFLPSGKPIQVFEYSFDARKQRAASVGRSLVRENSVGRTLSAVRTKEHLSHDYDRNNKYKRASSVGREISKTTRSLQQVKADFEKFRSKHTIPAVNIDKESKMSKTVRTQQESKTDFGKNISRNMSNNTNKDIKWNTSQHSSRIMKEDTSLQDQKSNQNKQNYYPKKNHRDPRMRNDHPVPSRCKTDSRSDSRESRKSGIIYSNDNIAKGTIMGSGFGVKNYKIPKIKRVEPELPQVKTKEKEITESVEITEVRKNSNKGDITKEKVSKVLDKAAADPILKNKNNKESKTSNNVADKSETRVTRSKKQSESISENKSMNDTDDVILSGKTKKAKKSVIYDSDSDNADGEIQDTEISTKATDFILDSPSKKANNDQKISSPVKAIESHKDAIEESVDSNFGLDETFSEPLESHSVIDNINALIADLDNDLNTSKVSNDGFDSHEEKNMEDAISPDNNILGDISDLIEKDLNKIIESQQNLVADNLAVEKSQKKADTAPNVKPAMLGEADNNISQIDSEPVDVTKQLHAVKFTIHSTTSVNEAIDPEQPIIQPDIENEKDFSTDNEDIVSTTEIEQEINESTIPAGIEARANESVSNKINDGTPDSTLNEIHCELSSDVTSTNDTPENSNKETHIQNSAQKETFNSIGSLLSILQDKSKIKELLAMLGDQSSDNEKIKKKLEKLSEIVSDDDEDEERKLDNMEEKLRDFTPEEKHEDGEPKSTTKNIDKNEVGHSQEEVQQSDEVSPAPFIEKKGKEDTSVDTNVENKPDKLSNDTVLKKAVVDEVSNVETNISHSGNENMKDEDEKNNETDKFNNDVRSDTEDNEPLANKVTKKTKSKKTKSKFKPNKKTIKHATQAAPAKTGVRKRGELQQLHEDINEFMGEDFLNPTGIRMCRLSKMVSEQENTDCGPVVLLEKVKAIPNQVQSHKIKKKPGPKPKNKPAENKSKSRESVTKMYKPKAVSKYKPGPKSKTKQQDDPDPYEFDRDSVTDTNTTKESDNDSSYSENESLASSHSFGSSEVLADTKKKQRRKRRGIGGWQSGIIKSKYKKKREQKQEIPKNDSTVKKPPKTITIPDLHCFTDKSYCFQKDATSYDCRLCLYCGADIVNHYKKQHPHNQIPLSRMDHKTSELAFQQCEQKQFQDLRQITSDKYTCRFCHKEFSNTRDVLETFFWHVVSNHTGEFKHPCSECVNISSCPFNLHIPPPPKDGGQLIGYICRKCNFTQISLENLKMHVMVHHNDEQTEVCKINLAVMSNKAMNAMLRRVQADKPRVLRSLRSNQSGENSSDIRDDRSDVCESSDQNSECDPSEPPAEESELFGETRQEQIVEKKPKIDKMKAKFTYEIDEPSDDSSVKLEQVEHDEITPSHDTLNANTTNINHSHRGNSDEIVDYPHFKLNYTESGAKEYVCCINGNDSHYKTSLLISMKKHIQSKHSEKWDGYCCVCKVIVTLQGVQSDFRDCLSHFLDKHMDDFPVLEKKAATSEEMEASNLSELNTSVTIPHVLTCILPTVASPVAAAALSPALPARVATPPVERTASPSYIAVRPLAELMSRELIGEIEPTVPEETPIALPKIESITSFGLESVPPAQPSPSYPNLEPVPLPAKPFLYEEVQAEVMSKKHRVVLDVMMSKENLVRVFKCAGRFCSFTTDSPEDALLHASTHQRVGGEGALNCAYCNYDASDNGIDLVMHVFKEHSHCIYCCPLCFYRAAASKLVSVHYSKAHHGAPNLKNVLRRKTTSAPPPPPESSTGLLTRDVAVQHFVCNHDTGACNFKTYIPGKFVEHLQQRHATAPTHPCNLCSLSAATPSELLLHLRTHGLKLYQCTWCVHGANNEAELLAHAAAAHPGAQPQAYVRIITGKEGEKRVLPLACLNKSQMVAEDMAPTASKENPVREAERSIELEKLIALTVINDSTSQNVSNTQVAEEPIEIPVENFPDDESDEAAESLNLESTTDQNISETIKDPVAASADKNDTSEHEPPLVKNEPPETLKSLNTSDIICLDSEDESEAPMDDATPDEPSSGDNEKAQKVNATVSRSSITDEVSITKVTEEIAASTEPKQNENRMVENIIDLSDEEPAPSTADRPYIMVDKASIFKCPSCLQVCKTVKTFKQHMRKSCAVPCDPTPKCPHRPCTFVAQNLNKLVHHYMNIHTDISTKKALIYYCGICNVPFPSTTGAKLHIRSIHKVSNYNVSMGLDEKGQTKYTIRKADDTPEPVRISGRKTSTEIQRYQAEPGGGRQRKASTEPRKRYGVADIDKIPINPILDNQVFCELCEFGTKVRLNMVRHLQQHAEKIPVPRTAPVNPVPHLHSNEMHFDKMVNLASSSVASRAPDKPRNEEPIIAYKIPTSESSRYPKYVPERIRYTCGARDCAYISVDMAMFRCHWETLHANEEEYRCVHCPPNQALTSVALSAARILAHLRMHDVSLYACSACSYYHYRQHLVEKHLAELHNEAFVKVVREEAQPEPPTAPPPPAAPTMDLKPWQCGLCDFSNMLRPTVATHCATDHHSKMQFKCSYCLFRSSAKENVVKHQSNAHAGMPEDVFYYFYREGSIPDENGVPLWQKQRQKMQLDDAEFKTEPEPELAPPTPPAPTSVSLAPITVDLNIVKEERSEEPSLNTELSIEELCVKFGQFCEPDGIKYKCCLCNSVREHKKETMQSHLYEELNYRRWECVICSYKAFHRHGLHEHMAAEHSRQLNAPKPLPVDVNIEKWVKSFLDHQAKAIESNLSNLSVQKIQGERPPAAMSPKKAESPKPTSSASDSELQNAFGDFGSPKNQLFACPKCEFITRDEAAMVAHLESELSKIRWGCTNCTIKYHSFHEAQFHCKSAHAGQQARPNEAIRDPSLRSGWVKAVVYSQRQFMKCISETNREPTPEKTTDSEDIDQSENSLLVALYDEPIQIDEQPTNAKRPAPSGDSEDERLVIDEPPTKKFKYKKCPFCDYSMCNSRYMREHILKEHYHLKPYKCCYCPFEGTRQRVTQHTNDIHFDLPKQIITVEVPETLPGEQATSKPKDLEVPSTPEPDKDIDSLTAAAKASNPVSKEIVPEEVAKKVCLYCEKSVPETEMESHTHGAEKAEFAKRGEVVVKCCKCLVLRLSLTSLQEHFDSRHPGEDVLENYAYFKLQVDTREIHCCGHCYKKFKFLRDLKVHHFTSHRTLSLSYTSIPFSFNLLTEGDVEIGKRKAEDTAGPSAKRIAKKSTAKPPMSPFAKKSTAKLPYMSGEEDFSNYGAHPSLYSPTSDSTIDIDAENLTELNKTNPKVVLKDYKS